MSNRAVKGFILLALLFFTVAAVVMGVFIFNQPVIRSQMGIPDSGGAVNSGPRPSVTPTRHLIPPVSSDVRGYNFELETTPAAFSLSLRSGK